MDDVARLLALEEIRTLKGRYFRALDTKDAASLKSVFVADATADFRGAATDPGSGINAVPEGTESIMQGAEAIAAGILSAVAGIVTVHHASVPEIEIVGDTEARGIWPMSDRLRMPTGGPVTEMIGYGHYHDTYRRDASGWRIASTKLTRLRVDVIAA